MLLHVVVLFIGGAALINAVPHLVAGVSGRRFPTPFASPPGKGLSPAPVNVLWGFANLAAAYGLLVAAGPLDPRRGADLLIAAGGALALGLYLSVRFGSIAARDE